jgi:hypothetical protein
MQAGRCEGSLIADSFGAHHARRDLFAVRSQRRHGPSTSKGGGVSQQETEQGNQQGDDQQDGAQEGGQQGGDQQGGDQQDAPEHGSGGGAV